MDTQTLSCPTTRVNLADETEVTVSDGHGLQIRHGGQLLTAMELAEAIKVAKMVLAYAEHYNLPTEVAAADISYLDEDAYYDMRAEMLEDWQAVVDSALERNGKATDNRLPDGSGTPGLGDGPKPGGRMDGWSSSGMGTGGERWHRQR